MGIVKIYNVLGSFYEYYNNMMHEISVHKVNKICKNYLCKMCKWLPLYYLWYLKLYHR